MPANSLKVDRTTRWGNPFRVGHTAVHPATGRRIRVTSRAMAVELFARWLRTPAGRALAKEARRALKGKNLACWCPLSAQVLPQRGNPRMPNPLAA